MMTNLEKIKTKVKHPLLEDPDFTSALNDRGLLEHDDYTESDFKAIELTRADLLMIMVGFPDIKEDAFSVSQKGSWSVIASGIYKKYGETDPSAPTLTDASSRW